MGVGTGDEIIMPLIPFRFGDLSDEIMDEVREGGFDLGSSRVRFEGRDFSIFFGVIDRCGGAIGAEVELCNGGGGGISAGLTPAAFAASCSMT
jgi:hypothetical protein